MKGHYWFDPFFVSTGWEEFVLKLIFLCAIGAIVWYIKFGDR